MEIQFNYFFFILWILTSCANEDETPVRGINAVNNQESAWLVPENQVLDGGVGKDGIPSIDRPNFTVASEVTFLKDDDLVLGIAIGNEVKAYPHPILDWHEIVNDEIGGEAIALTYCPLTGTGIGWGRTINNEVTTFGVSGLLYNTNLMPYDRATNSTWSQQRLDCVNGENKGLKAEAYTFVETSWASWKRAYPASLVLNTDTGFNRDYARYPYGDYRTNNNNIIFPISNNDDRLPAKERVLGIQIKESFEAFTFNNDEPDIELVEDNIEGVQLLIVRSTTNNYIVAFDNPNDGRLFAAATLEEYPVILKDDQGNSYDLLGKVVAGSGTNLEMPVQFIGYWFSWGAFYPNITIF